MTHRPILLLLVLLALLPAGTAHGATRASWNLDEQRAVRQAGVMHDLDDQAFHGDRPVAGSQLPDAFRALAARLALAPVAVPAGGVTVATFDRLLVAQLGAADVAAAVQHEAWRAGLQPPAMFGTEVVARSMGLRTNHPFPAEQLELYPTDAITRAEAAHSFAQALRIGTAAAGWARLTFASFHLPAYTVAQRLVLHTAVSRIGMPYVWGGETDRASSYFGGQVHGGYDCSGLVWRVFKLSGLPWGWEIRGRTAAQQAGEIPRAARLRADALQPADLLFFGSGRFWQQATERRIVHEGIALAPDWVIHASAQGVYVLPLAESYLGREFSWGRRIL
jgi:cell wall-associated NlpC family hydrolase